MSYLWHDLMNYVWEVLFALGIIFGALIWIALAIWDRIKSVGNKLSGEIRESDGTDGTSSF